MSDNDQDRDPQNGADDRPTEVFDADEQHEQDHPTEVMPPVPEASTQAYSDYEDYPEYLDPDDAEENFYAALARQEYGTYHWDNLPSEAKYGSDYVVRDAYDEVYGELLASGESEARAARRYQVAWQRVETLESEQEGLRRDVNDAAERNRIERNSVEADKRDVEERRAELEARERKDLTIKIALGVIATLLAISTVVFCMLWLSARSDRDSVSQGSAAQQEQVQQMKDNLNAMQSERDQATAENRALSERADGLNQQIADARKANEETQVKIEEKDKEIRDLTERLNEAENAPAETVTETAVREGTGRTVTETQSPSTVTVTETATENP